MRSHPLIVLKFGSSVLCHGNKLPKVVHEIYRWVRDGYRGGCGFGIRNNGTDAAQKLVLLAKAAFGVELKLENIVRRGVEHLDCEYVREQESAGKVIRLVGTLQFDGTGALLAKVAPQALAESDPLAETWAEHCCLTIEGYDGTGVVLHGKGAGRWPTTESVMADLHALLRRGHMAHLDDAGLDIAAIDVALSNGKEFAYVGGVQ